MMDFCTRYPEAVPLRKIDASTVADALCEIFTRLGLPEEILSDQGSNFMSTLMKRVMEILQVKQLRTVQWNVGEVPRNAEGYAEENIPGETGVGHIPALCMLCVPRLNTHGNRVLTIPATLWPRYPWTTLSLVRPAI